MTTSGYDGPLTEEEEKIPSPEARTWRLEVEDGLYSQIPGVIFCRVEVDGEVLGTLRLPNSEHLRWLRERVQE